MYRIWPFDTLAIGATSLIIVGQVEVHIVLHLVVTVLPLDPGQEASHGLPHRLGVPHSEPTNLRPTPPGKYWEAHDRICCTRSV